MGLELLLQGTSTAASVGMGCGTCCSPGISLFLSGYTMTHAKSGKQSILAFLSFYFGKLVAVVAVCMATSAFGRTFLDDSGKLAGVNVRLLVNLMMAGMSVLLIIKWIKEKVEEKNGNKAENQTGRKKSCHCHSCKNKNAVRVKKDSGQHSANYGLLAVLGVGYGISPCAPLLMMAGYAATMPLQYAAVSAGVFALASSLSPMLLLLMISGALSGKMQKEVPEYLNWFRLGCYVLLLVFSISPMIQ